MGLWEQCMESYGLNVMGLGVKLRRSKVVMYYFSCQPDRIYNYQKNCHLDMPVKIILITLIGMWRSILIVLRIIHWEGDPGLDILDKYAGWCWLSIVKLMWSIASSPSFLDFPTRKDITLQLWFRKKCVNMNRENFTGTHSQRKSYR